MVNWLHAVLVLHYLSIGASAPPVASSETWGGAAQVSNRRLYPPVNCPCYASIPAFTSPSLLTLQSLQRHALFQKGRYQAYRGTHAHCCSETATKKGLAGWASSGRSFVHWATARKALHTLWSTKSRTLFQIKGETIKSRMAGLSSSCISQGRL